VNFDLNLFDAALPLLNDNNGKKYCICCSSCIFAPLLDMFPDKWFPAHFTMVPQPVCEALPPVVHVGQREQLPFVFQY
jgi:hypothetical protein